MAEDSGEQNSEPLNIQRYLDVVRRRHMQFLIPAFLGWLIVWGASWVLPARYKSGTLILVEQPTMPKNYVTPNISDDLQERLQSITQQILSRTRLLYIIDKLHLYSGARKQMSPDDKVELMRKDIDIELVRDTRTAEISAFRVSFSARDPHLAQQVTSELTDLFIEENGKKRQQESQDTTKFIEDQLENARATLAEQEAKVRQYEALHEGELPSQQASNLQILSGLQSQLENEQDALNTARQQQVYIQAMIDQNRAFHGTSRTVEGAATSSNARTDLASIEQELTKMRAQLADLSSRYTDRYPDVQNLKNEIAKTEIARDKLIEDQKHKSNEGKQPGGIADTGDPALNAAQLQLQGQLEANRLEIANRAHAIADLKSRINDYQGRLNAEPATDQQLAELTRGYDQSKANYDDLLKKKNESEMATSMEQMQQGERFTMLDPPSLPTKPDFPQRLKFCGIGLGVGVAFGLVFAGGLEFLDDRLHDESQIKALLPTAVIAEIPVILNPSDTRANRKRLVLGWVMTCFVVATILAGSAISYLHD